MVEQNAEEALLYAIFHEHPLVIVDHAFEPWEGEVGDPSTCDRCGFEESQHERSNAVPCCDGRLGDDCRCECHVRKSPVAGSGKETN